MHLVIGPGIRSVGRFMPRDVKLIASQHLFPLGIGPDHPLLDNRSLRMPEFVKRNNGHVFSWWGSGSLSRSDRNNPGKRKGSDDQRPPTRDQLFDLVDHTSLSITGQLGDDALPGTYKAISTD